MKKNYLLFLILFLFQTTVYSNEKRINLYGGYVFDDKFESYADYYNYYNGKISGGFQFGAGLEFKTFSDFGWELLYIGQSTSAPTYSSDSGYQNNTYDLSLNYALLAGNKYFQKENSKVEGYLGFMIGALFAEAKNPLTDVSNSAVKFSWGVRLGANYWVSDKVGIRLQTQLLSSVQSAGGELYFGSAGYTYGATTASSMLQFSFNTGLIFRFTKNSDI
jgi:hypothetical protein